MQRTARHARDDKRAAFLGALTIVAHDLRGPLANLSVLIELIDAYTQAQAFDRIKVAAGRAQAMIDALEDMLNGFIRRARETGDPLAFKPAMVDAADAVRDAVDLNRPLAETRQIGFDLAQLQPCAVWGDGRLLGEAIGNLVSNATKYAPAGSTVHCRVERRAQTCVISVSDEGEGLSAADLSKAFRPFSNLSSTYDGRGSSWGLGLWIVRLICERHGGRVEARAGDSGSGARFEIHLPLDGP
jgi:signal transduction histidine kinase